MSWLRDQCAESHPPREAHVPQCSRADVLLGRGLTLHEECVDTTADMRCHTMPCAWQNPQICFKTHTNQSTLPCSKMRTLLRQLQQHHAGRVLQQHPAQSNGSAPSCHLSLAAPGYPVEPSTQQAQVDTPLLGRGCTIGVPGQRMPAVATLLQCCLLRPVPKVKSCIPTRL